MKQSNDIFVSYAHVDNNLYSNESNGWIDRFLKDLKQDLNRLFGRSEDYTIWKDEQLRGNQSLTSQIINELEHVKILLVFYSKGYQKSKWCQDEFKYFTERVGTGSDRIFFIMQDDCPPPETYKDDFINYCFWGYSEKKVSYRLGSLNPSNPESDYLLRCGDVAKDLYATIKSLNQQHKQPKTTIYLAQVSKKLISQREALIRELEQHRQLLLDKTVIAEEASMRDKEAQTPIKAFISYSHKDTEEGLQALKSALAPYRRLQNLELWSDHAIDAGDTWEKEIFKQLESADIVLCLISQDFINSDFCHRELESALKNHHKGKQTIVPILWRHCYWDELPIAKLQGASSEWIKSQVDMDLAWTEVAKKLKPVIQQAKKRLFRL